MKIKTSLFLTALLIFICCIGAASATEDITDDVISSDSDVTVVEQADDVALEVNNDEDVLSTGEEVSTWTDLKNKAENTSDQTINLASGTIDIGSDNIQFANNAVIIGKADSYISGNASGRIPFTSTSNSALQITFQNVNFRNIHCQMLIQLQTTGTSILNNCTFTNITAGTGHDSVVYNNLGTMNITDCTFSDCTSGYGVVSNYMSGSTTGVTLNVRGSTFENNYASTEPGCINNCGQLYVWASTFNNNRAAWWAGAIHTHTNAKSVIRSSSFNGNVAGWNGGALYTYSDLEVYDSNFTNNNCTTNNGGGAIGASNYFFASKAYNVTVNNCKFEDNNNLHSNGYGGAIAAMNGGTLYVNGSTFIHNAAKKGQAIAGFNTNKYSNISEGNSHLVITNNKFINHTKYSGTTVLITGDYYTFENNKFINSPQTVYNGNGNTYNSASSSSLKKQNNLLGASYQEILSDDKYLNDGDNLNDAITSIEYGSGEGTIYLSKGTYYISSKSKTMLQKNIVIIGSDETIINVFELSRSEISNYESVENGKGTLTWINVTFNTPISINGINNHFINCTFNSTIDLEKSTEEYYIYNPDGSFDYDSDMDAYWNGIELFDYTFEHCDFINVSNYVIHGYRFANITISNCNFENIIVDNVIETNCDKGFIFYEQDWDVVANFGETPANVILKDSTFKNTNIKSIIKAKTTSEGNVIVENNQYDFVKYQKTNDDEYTYIDVPVAVDSEITITNESDVVIITVTADGKAVSGATVNYTIGDDKKSNVTDVNGQIKISGLTDAFEIVANYFGNPYINSNSSSQKFNFTKSTLTDNTNSSTNGTSTTPGKTNTNTNKQTTTKITKKATKITAKKVTFKAKKKTKKYTIVLKAGKKAVKKVKVTLKVGKKTYKATTNSKGKATIKITKLNKKGKYTAVIKFKGNKYYKATSKKVKITVKK